MVVVVVGTFRGGEGVRVSGSSIGVQFLGLRVSKYIIWEGVGLTTRSYCNSGQLMPNTAC